MEEQYSFEHVIAYAVIGLYNLLNSANKENIDLQTMVMFVEPLKDVHKKEFVINFAKKLLEDEKEIKKSKI